MQDALNEAFFKRVHRGLFMIHAFRLGVVVILFFAVGCSSRCEVLPRKEEVLKEDLYVMRQAIDQFTMDKNAAPTSLEDLIRAGYVGELPIDPMTGSRLTWKIVQEDTTERIDDRIHPPAPPGITDVHSGSELVSSEGTRYSSW